MATSKRRPTKSKAPLDPFLANLLREQNIKLDEVGKNPTEADLRDSPQRTDFRGEAVLISLRYPTAEKIVKTCKREICKQVFTSNYQAVGYCSRRCLELDLKEQYGIAWTPRDDFRKERWEILEEPYMIPEKALRAMKQLVLDVERRLGRPIQIDEDSTYPQIQVQENTSEKPAPIRQPVVPTLKNREEALEDLKALLGDDSLQLSPPLHKTEAPVQEELSQSEVDDWLFS